MDIKEQISKYISEQNPHKSSELQTIHELIIHLWPTCRLWYLDGKDSNGKVVTNPNIGYGTHTLRSKNGKIKEFYKLGISSNSIGISLYVMGLSDKKYLINNYGKIIGKATVTGYCIKFKSLKDIDLKVFEHLVLESVREE